MTEPNEFNLDEIDIRLAGPADHAIVRELYLASILEGRVRENDTGADIDDLVQGYFSDEGASCFWVACHHGSVIGMIGVQRTRENAVEMRRLGVLEVYRRRGVGRRLLETAVEFCRQRGYLKVVLDVRVERNPAIALFEECGFHHSRTREIGDHKVFDFFLDLYSDPGGESG